MNMKRMFVVLACLSLSMVQAKENAEDKAPDEGPVITLGAKGKFSIVNTCRASEEPLEIAARKMGNSLMIKSEVVVGTWSLAKATEAFKATGANAAVFVVNDPALPLSLVAMEEKWGVVNARGLNDDQLQKEALRVSTVVLGGALSKFAASPMRPAYSVKDLDKVGSIMTFDSLMAIMPHLEAMGLGHFSSMSYRDACYNGVAPAPKDERERKIAAEVKAELAAEASRKKAEQEKKADKKSK